MNKNRKIRNFILLKALPLILALSVSIGIGYIVNIIPFVNNLNKSNTIAVFSLISVVSAFIFFGLFHKGIMTLDNKRAEKAMQAKFMLGVRVINEDIKNSKEAKEYLKTKKSEFDLVEIEYNKAIRTLKYFESKVKHIDEV